VNGPVNRPADRAGPTTAGRAGLTPAGRTAPAPGHSFGEEGGKLTYGSYLRLPELLAQQVPQVDPPAHDELLFITVHQAYELWFGQLLHELTAARDAMLAGETWRARHLLRRTHVIERLLVSQIDVLETMTPQDFLEFRAALAPASGFQSVQFRELEFLSGAKAPKFIARFRELTAIERERLSRRLAEPSLWDAFTALLASRGLPVSSDDEVLAALVAIARDRAHHDEEWQLAEDLLTHDEIAGLWRARHVQMVERQIGTKSGTGGSTGAPYLQRRVPLRYYPLLWELRDWL
jgi:tryptophan 2,3-dioxygenase